MTICVTTLILCLQPMQGPMRLKMCLGVKHTLTNRKKGQRMKPNDSQVHFHFGRCIHARIMNVQNLG